MTPAQRIEAAAIAWLRRDLMAADRQRAEARRMRRTQDETRLLTPQAPMRDPCKAGLWGIDDAETRPVCGAGSRTDRGRVG